MRKFFLAGVIAVAVTAPATARDRGLYVGIEGGTLSGRDNDIDDFVDYATVQSPATPLAPAGPADVEFDDAFRLNYKKGYDFDAVAGYDFGWIRLEAELGHKRAGIKSIVPDETADGLIGSLNSALNRPSSAPDPGAPGLPALTADEFDRGGNVSTTSGMVNALIDIGIAHGFSIYGGGGFGRARVKALSDADSAWANQWIFGARYAISSNVDLGLKYRYFNSGIVSLKDEGTAYDGNPDRLSITPPIGPAAIVDQTTDALVAPELEGRFRSRSWLVSLIYKFGGANRPSLPEPDRK